MVKKLPLKQETQVWSLGQEDPLGNTLHFSCLENSMDRGAWEGSAGGWGPWGRKEPNMAEQVALSLSTF